METELGPEWRRLLKAAAAAMEREARAAMELHRTVGGPKFKAFAPLIRLRSIDVHGRPSPAVVERAFMGEVAL